MSESCIEFETTKDQFYQSETKAYSSSREHVVDELKLLELFLMLQMKKEIISEGDRLSAEMLIDKRALYDLKGNEFIQNSDETILEQDLINLEQQIEKRIEVSLEKGIKLSLPHISKILNLSFFEERCIIACLAPEIDRRFEKIYAYIQDNILAHTLTIDMALKLFSGSEEERISLRDVFVPQAPLMKFFMENPNGFLDNKVPLIARPLKLVDWAVNYLLDFEVLDEDLIHVANLFPAEIQVAHSELVSIEENIIKFIKYFQSKEKHKSRQIFYLYGPDGGGKKSHIMSVCQRQGYTVISVDIKKMLVSDKSFSEMLKLLGRHAMFGNTALCFENFHILLEQQEKYVYKCELLINMLINYAPISFILGRHNWNPVIYDRNLSYVQIECPLPDARERGAHWEISSHNYKFDSKINLDIFTESFQFTPGQIQGALNYSESLAVWNGNINGLIGEEELYNACYSQSNRKLNVLATKITPIYNWEVLVLPSEQMSQLREICNQMKYRSVVYGDWGFGKRLSLGKGINVLFSGPPGSGKTMAAEVIANDLGLEIYKIDLSQIVSKYIGETEKNLEKIFLEAETSNAILFFDEADSMFGKRSEVKDAHDRYANLETSYLLQKMEEYKGIVILATNLNENMDEAFLRRLNFSIQFPFPEKEQRKSIWKGMFPKGAPLDSDIDYEFMADKFILAGGSIKNIALNAAFYAAKEEKCIGMQHIMLAAKREYRKLGKTFLKSDFDPYYKMIEVI